MRVNRRFVLGGVAAVAMLPHQVIRTAAQSTPEATTMVAPGYGVARVRVLPSPELNAAIFPDVMARFLPATEAVPGYAGYIFSNSTSDPSASITMTFTADEAAAAAASEVAKSYVAGLDPRFEVETPIAEEGPVRTWQVTDRPASELPPFLNGCQLTMRNRTNAPGTDGDAITAKVNAELAPQLAALPGFVLYCVIVQDDGRTAINIWETAEHLAAGNDLVRAWATANFPDAFTGDPVVSNGVVGYANIVGFV
ncbi:MAG: hypothetical protein U0031_23645 [Thermomicrobiales bacterium]